MTTDPKDLIVLVADGHMEQMFYGLLSRHHSLSTRELTFDIRVHPGHDAGCRSSAHQYLRPFITSHGFALVVFDLDGSGSEESREQTQDTAQTKLEINGWEGRCRVIVIEPELESWIWTPSPIVSQTLGWGAKFQNLRQFLQTNNYWPEESSKPCDPKGAMEFAITKAPVATRPKKSAALFGTIANKVGFGKCNDPAFTELLATLRHRFPMGV